MKQLYVFCYSFLIAALTLGQSNQDLALHLNFDNNITDQSGNNYIGQLNGTAGFTTGLNDELNGALNCPAAADNLDFQTNVSLEENITVSVWFKITEDRYSQGIVGNFVNCQTSEDGFGISYYGTPAGGNANLRFFAGRRSIQSFTDLNDGEWHHAVLVIGDNDYTAYLDDVLIDNQAHALTSVDNGDNLFVGFADKTAAACGNNNSTNFTGAIDELRVYNRILTRDQISDLYNGLPGLILCSSYDDNTLDQSGNNFHGTLNGATFTEGLNGEALSAVSFPTSTAHVNYGDTIPLPGAFSVSIWFNLSEDRYSQALVGNYINCQTPNNGFGITYYGTPAGNPNVRYFLGTGSIQVFENVADNEWHHAVLTVDGTDYRAYLDGQLKETKSGSYNPSAEDLYVGFAEKTASACGNNNSTNTTGSIDELKIYDGTLTDSQINDIYNQGIITSTVASTANQGIKLYPNPSNGTVRIESTQSGSFRILSSTGLEIQKGEIENSSLVRDLEAGLYFVQIYDANQELITIEKVLVK